MKCYLVPLIFLIAFTASGQQQLTKAQKRDYDFGGVTLTLQPIFADYFRKGNINDWSEGRTGESLGVVKNGTYLWESLSDRPRLTFKRITVDQNKDFEVTLNVEYAKGKKAAFLHFGSDNNSYLAIALNQDTFTVVRVNNGVISTLVPKTKNTYIWLEGMNRLTVRRLGDAYYFFCNKRFLAEVDYQPFYGDIIGFAAVGNSAIKVGSFGVWYLE